MDILHLLGIEKSIIVLNKCDIVDEEWLELVEEEVAEFVSWYECKDMIPEIRELGTMAAQDVSWRMGKTFHEMQFAPEVCHQLADAVEQTAAKVFQKMLFGVRDHADSDVMRECLDALGQVWKKE